MIGNFIVFSEQQTDWMRRAVKQMMKLAVYYGTREQPLKDEDYDHIAHTFADYTKKSRNNALIIGCSVAFMVYLDGVGQGTPALNERQIEQMETATDEMFAMLQRQEPQDEMHIKEYSDGGELFQELQEVFQEYASECSRQSEVRTNENSKGDELGTSRQCDGKSGYVRRMR